MIAFFDIDGTLTSEKDGQIPQSAIEGIRQARENGHKMFLCSGRTRITIEDRFLAVGFDGVICGCGTQIFFENGEMLLHRTLDPETTQTLLRAARETGVEILFEASGFVAFDPSQSLSHPVSIEHVKAYHSYGLDPFRMDVDAPDFSTDKFIIFSDHGEAVQRFLSVAEQWMTCIDRGRGMYEMIPKDFSKATGIQTVLDYYGIDISQAYAFGDSNNDLAMLRYVPHSVVMGNATPPELKKQAWYVAKNASEDGILLALKDLGFLNSYPVQE